MNMNEIIINSHKLQKEKKEGNFVVYKLTLNELFIFLNFDKISLMTNTKINSWYY